MASSGSGPPTFAESAKFDRSNWVTWSGLIKIAAELRGAFGYLDGSINNPSATTPDLTSPQNVPLPSSPIAQTTMSPGQPPTIVNTSWESMTP
jgi:hypothetical protein